MLLMEVATRPAFPGPFLLQWDLSCFLAANAHVHAPEHVSGVGPSANIKRAKQVKAGEACRSLCSPNALGVGIIGTFQVGIQNAGPKVWWGPPAELGTPASW